MSEWSEVERQRYRRQQAHRAAPLAMLPNARPVWADDLDVDWRERRRQVVAFVLVAAFVVAIIVAPLAIGGFLISVFGL